MDFNSAQAIDSICWSFRYADYFRSQNRARINNLFNGVPPYSPEEVLENNISVNVNFLETTVKGHDARSQFYQAFMKPGNFFTAKTDTGPVHKRNKWENIVTKEASKVMKNSLPYMECFRAKIAMNVLHGIAPAGFRDDTHWCPEPFGVEDVMVPANTLLTMRNLPFFAIHRSFTGPELIKLTKGPKVDKAWNMPLVNACIAWIDSESTKLMQTNWPEVWSPEKVSERVKSDGGFYAYDNSPTIEAWDFYFWNDDKKVSGWNRRMILDAWQSPTGVERQMARKDGVYDSQDTKDQFLYNPTNRKYADIRENIINWQFADLSAVAPFRYHSVRSLGFLLYAVGHLQNRMRCKFSESVFEQLMIYFRVKSADEMQRALKIELFNRGFVDDSIEFIKATDRYQVNTSLVELGLNENANIIDRNSASNTGRNQQLDRSSEKPTATQWMGEEQKVTQLVSAGLLQAYHYQRPEYREIFRRLCKKHSPDPEVKGFQAACLRQGVPEKMLVPEVWDIEPEQIMGGGNKTLEMAIAQQLMMYRNLYDPESQREILHDVTLAITDSAAKADSLVPDSPMKVSDSVHDAELSAGVLLQGLPVSVKTGMNHIEYVETLMKAMATVLKKIKAKQGKTDVDELFGINNLGQNISQHIQMIAQDKNEKARVKAYGDALGQMMNMVNGLGQNLKKQMEEEARAQGGVDAETKAKIISLQAMTEAKAANTRESHAQRTVQRQLQFEQEMKQQQQEFEHEMRTGSGEAQTLHDMKLAQAETQHGMSIDRNQAALDQLSQQHEMRMKQQAHDQDLALARQQAEHKMELQQAESEHKRRLEEKKPKQA